MKLKSINDLNLQKIQNPDQIRGGKYWDTTVASPSGGEYRDHECPNGNLLVEIK